MKTRQQRTWNNCIAVVRERDKACERGKAWPSIQLCCIWCNPLPVRAVSSTVFTNLKFKYQQRAEAWLKTHFQLSAELLKCAREPTKCANHLLSEVLAYFQLSTKATNRMTEYQLIQILMSATPHLTRVVLYFGGTRKFGNVA